MTCACNSSAVYTVVLPGGVEKKYSSQAAAQRKVDVTPGAYLRMPPPES